MQLPGKFSFRASDLWIALALTAVYFLTGQVGLIMGAGYRFSAPVWPPTGIGLAAILLLGYRAWPGLFAGSLLVGLVWLWRLAPGPWSLLSASLCMACGNTLESLAGAWLVNRFASGKETFRQPATILLFVALVAVVSLGLGASAGVAACYLAKLAAARNAGSLWFAWWLGGLVSAIVVTPMVVLWSTRSMPRLSVRRALEGSVLLILSTSLCLLVFQDWYKIRTASSPLAFLVIPSLLWTSLRFGQRGTAMVALLIAGFATLGTLEGHGPFALGDRNLSLLLLQNFLAVITVMSLILAADVAQRQSIESQLRASEQRYRDLFEHSPQPLWVHSHDALRFLAVNEAAVRLYGYDRAEFLHMTVPELVLPEQKDEFMLAVQQIQQGQDYELQWRHRTKTGALLDVEITTQNLLFDGIPASIVLCKDITERKRSELHTRAFSELGRRLSAASSVREAAQMVMGTADVLFGWDACLFDLYFAEKAELVTILGFDTIAGKRTDVTADCKNLSSGTYALEALTDGARLILRPQPVFAPDRRSFGNKDQASASLMFAPVRKERQAIAVLSIQSYQPRAYDESDLRLFQAVADHCASALERIRAEDEVRRLNRELGRRLEELETIFNVAPVGLAVTRDSDSQLVTSNPAFAAMLGLTSAEPGRENSGTPKIVRNGEEVPAGEWPMNLAATKGVSVQGEELDLLRPDGKRLHCYMAAAPLYDESAHVRGSLGVFVDLTERKRAEQEILRLNSELERRVRERTAQLEAINKELEAFSYSVSHDLRAPLRSIRGFSEVLLERYSSKLDGRGQEFLRRACESSQHMDRLIEDLLKLSRVGRSELQHQTVDLSRLAEDTLNELKQAHPSQTVQASVEPGLRARGDERLLRIVLENLLRNAWKFTSKQPSARVEVGLDRRQKAFFVRDNGAGFEMEYAQKLFGVFQRLHSAADFPGTGVGLATVQRIINRHGGQIWAEAAVGKGACFYFTVPAEDI